MSTLIRFQQSEETLEWIDENIQSGWHIFDEDWEHLDIAFDSRGDAEYAMNMFGGEYI